MIANSGCGHLYAAGIKTGRINVQKALAALKFAIDRSAKYPNASPLLADIANIKKSADDILKLMDGDATKALQLNTLVGLDIYSDVISCLGHLQTRCVKLIKDNPRRQGMGKVHPEEGPTEGELCALIACLIARDLSLDKAWPSCTKIEVWELCAALWDEVDRQEKDLESWKKFVRKSAKFQPPHEAGMHIERLLFEKDAYPAEKSVTLKPKRTRAVRLKASENVSENEIFAAWKDHQRSSARVHNPPRNIDLSSPRRASRNLKNTD